MHEGGEACLSSFMRDAFRALSCLSEWNPNYAYIIFFMRCLSDTKKRLPKEAKSLALIGFGRN